MEAIGEPLWANFTVGQYNDKYTDSVILNWSHEIDLALYLLGPGRVTHCSTRSSDGRLDLADILFLHDSGCRTTIHLDYITQPEVRQFIIVGNKASIIVDIPHNQAWLRGADQTIWDHCEETDSFDDNYKDEMQAFIDRLDGKKTHGCTGAEGLEVLKVCLDAQKLSQSP
jgi:predicted dehydrogenase